ncbi:MAG TPA: HAD-IIIA family hydrolase [candidate division Zixibacteria bacterium]|nr:HAD-IIIA family hydrolase [candidate division Zixibacteria bacterium]
MRGRGVSGLADVTGVILAGGLGTRLRSIVADRPKVLAEVCGRPFLAYLLDRLSGAGLRNIVISTGYLGEQIERAFGNCYRNLRLVYSREARPLGTGGALRLALPLLDSDPVLVLNGDSCCDADLHSFWRSHVARQARATLLLVRAEDMGRYGSVECGDDGQVTAFREKGRGGEGWISAGVYLIDRSLIEEISAGETVSLETDVFPGWIGCGLFAYRGSGRFIDIGTPESFAAAERFFAPDRAAPQDRRFVVLDRDGTINEEREYLSDPDQVRLIPGAAEGLRRLKEMGLGLVVITNQSGVGRGYFDRARLDAIHRRLSELLQAEGVALDGIYVCPHTPEDKCSCRKPRTALLDRAAGELGFKPELGFVIGDKPCDIEMGAAVGATTFLVRTGYGAHYAADGAVCADHVVEDLREACAVIRRLLEREDREVARDHQ